MGYDYVRTPILGYGGDQTERVEEALDLNVAQNPVPDSATGENMLRNGSLEEASGWHIGAGWTMPFATPDARHGGHVGRLTSSGTPGELVSDPVAIADIDDSYIVSFAARLNTWTRGSARAVLRAYDIAGVLLLEHVLLEMGEDYAGADTLGVWLDYSRQFAPQQFEEIDDVLPEDTATVRLAFGAQDAVLQWDVDATMFARGWQESAFTPSPNEAIDGTAILPGTVPPTAFDTTPPGVPTGLMLSSDAEVMTDGTAVSKVHATITHPTDADYVGSEIQVTGDYTQSNPLDVATRIPVWAFARTLQMPKDGTRVTYQPAVGGAPYWARARSIDQVGNRSSFGPVVILPAAIDADAPPIPTIGQTVPGFRAVGIWWTPVAAADLSHYEVRWRQRSTVASDETGDTVIVFEWESLRTRATVAVVSNLEPASEYTFQVRAVDLSGNVRLGRTLAVITGAGAIMGATTLRLGDGRGMLPGMSLVLEGDATTYSVRAVVAVSGVVADLTVAPPLGGAVAVGTRGSASMVSFVPLTDATAPDAGWSVPVVAVPSLVGSTDIAANAILANMIAAGAINAGHIQAGAVDTDKLAANAVTAEKIQAGQIMAVHIHASGISADQLKTGTLTVGGSADSSNPDLIILLNDQDEEIGRFDLNGALFKDPSNTQKQVRWLDGALSFSDDAGATWSTAIDARGITADSISIGTAPGGHNAIPNSSFERTPVAAASATKTWTVTTDWDDLLAGGIYVDVSGSALQLTGVTY